jgi:hypothetical protein
MRRRSIITTPTTWRFAEARVHKLFDKTIYLASEHHTGNYPGIVVNLVGDMVSGRAASGTAQNRRA